MNVTAFQQRQPGHAQKNCPDCYHNDRTRGYFDIEGGETSNYSGGCWNSEIIYIFILEPDGSIMKILSFFFPFHPISICFPSPLLKHLNSFLLLPYWRQLLLPLLNSIIPLLFQQNIPFGIRSMPTSLFRYEESYMVYTGDISKTHHFSKK